ncbi:MAG: putative metal-binding motif-containing protein, partial [Myxococcales bacterium]|nr:putative metal-binding motif-containing protein [Myxococcales bacterium]
AVDDGFGSDFDQDGVTEPGGDCDDTDAAIHPGAPEVPDAADQDCDDRDPAVHPAAPEVCNGVDDDCDGQVDDEDDEVVGAPTWYLDSDGDGHGHGGLDVISACEAPRGYVESSDDCDDEDPDFHPGAVEDDCTDPNDYDCDGLVAFADDDQDGVAACEDCDDQAPGVYPGATEVCNGIDDDCDGAVDAADLGVVGAQTYHPDSDGDGYGDPAVGAVACQPPQGYVSDASDCDDQDASLNPETQWYIDFDGDGWGADSSFTQAAC